MCKQQNHNTAGGEETSYDHVLKYTGIFGGVQGMKMLLNVGRVKLTSLLLGGAGIGLISAYNAVAEFLVTAGNMGIPLNATRQMGELYGRDDEAEKTRRAMVIRTWVLWSALLAVLICLPFSPFISYFFFDEDWSRWSEVMPISLIAVGLIVAEGECAILKGLRQVRKVAVVETLIAFSSIVSTIPLYYLLGIRGVIYGLIASALMAVIVHFAYTLPLIPYRVAPLSKQVFRDGLPLIKVGVPFVLAGVANAGLMMAVPAIILAHHTLADLGHYQAGWTIMVTYAGLVFVALEADYFPRLTSVAHDRLRTNSTICQQIDVCTLIITPLLILLSVCMPMALTLLYEPGFLVVVDMARLAIFYPFLRCLALPMGYSILAKGHSLAYLLLEVCFDLCFGVLIWWSYNNYGLMGGGIAMSLGALYDVAILFTYCHLRYGFVLRRSTLLIYGAQLACMVTAAAALLADTAYGDLRYAVAIVAFLASVGLSVYCMGRYSDFMGKLLRRFTR